MPLELFGSILVSVCVCESVCARVCVNGGSN